MPTCPTTSKAEHRFPVGTQTHTHTCIHSQPNRATQAKPLSTIGLILFPSGWLGWRSISMKKNTCMYVCTYIHTYMYVIYIIYISNIQMYCMYRVCMHNVYPSNSWASTLSLPISWPLDPQVSPVTGTWACEPPRPIAPLQLLVQTQWIPPVTELIRAVHPAASPGSLLSPVASYIETHIYTGRSLS